VILEVIVMLAEVLLLSIQWALYAVLVSYVDGIAGDLPFSTSC
jgi:hypothetical protein